jgi:transposase
MEETIATSPRSEVAAYVGIDWADQKHDVVVRSEAEPTKVQHQVITHSPESLLDWVAEMQQRFAGKGKILVCLEQSRGALIYHLMGYEFFELYPINPNQLANYRAAFKNSGAKDDGPDADLLCELVMCHRERLKAWKPDTELTRKLATLNEDRRQAVDRRTRLANGIKSTLKVYFPLALQVLDNDTSTALAADLLLQWPCLEALQKQSPAKLRKFFYAHNCRGEQKMLERLKLIKEAQALTRDLAVIEPGALKCSCWPSNSKAFYLILPGTKNRSPSSLTLIPIVACSGICRGPGPLWLLDSLRLLAAIAADSSLPRKSPA